MTIMSNIDETRIRNDKKITLIGWLALILSITAMLIGIIVFTNTAFGFMLFFGGTMLSCQAYLLLNPRRPGKNAKST
jgi:hypothetical protein